MFTFDIIYAIGIAFLSIIYSLFAALSVLKRPEGNEKMKEISKAIREGSRAYLLRQYYTILPIVFVLFALLWHFLNLYTAISFVIGAFFSALAGYIGMNVSVRANVRVANQAKRGLKEALEVAFKGGTVTGFMVVGLGLLGVSSLYYLFNDIRPVVGFGFGASLLSLFMRVAGGIYTKAADVGADLVGKVEKGIPEDDPRNPAVIADNVGDNVGDCAGMAADLFESYAVTLIAAVLLGLTFGQTEVIYPFILGSLPIAASILGTFFVKLGRDKNIWKALYKSVWGSVIFSIVFLYAVTSYLSIKLEYFYSAVIGIVITLLIGYITEYYTSRERKPVVEIAESSLTGAGTNIITGLAIGFKSTTPTVLVIVGGIILSYMISGAYGVALAALSMISLTGIIVSIDSYGPITDNAGGISEMANLSSRVRKVTDALDAVGNTTKAVTKGFAIGCAALAALSLFVAYAQEVNLTSIDILEPNVIAGLFIGGALPFLFSAFCLKAVGKAAFSIIEEVRRQFKTIKGLIRGRAKPDYSTCVDITTKASLREFIKPGLLAIVSPLLVGFLFGPHGLGGMLAGSIVTGFLLAIMMANTGAAWDNAKKYIEAGNFGGKGSDAHKAAVVGDTVGDPFKDTAGPSLNPLIKVINMLAFLFASYFVLYALL